MKVHQVLATSFLWVFTVTSGAAAYAEPTLDIRRVLDNGSVITLLLEEESLRMQYSHHWEGKKGFCQQERVVFADVQSHIGKLDYSFDPDSVVRVRSVFNDTAIKLDAYGKNRFLCQWAGASGEARIRQVNFDFGFRVNVPEDETNPITVHFIPERLALQGLDIREVGMLGDILEQPIERTVNHYSQWFFQSSLGVKLAQKLEKTINTYLAKHGSDILYLD